MTKENKTLLKALELEILKDKSTMNPRYLEDLLTDWNDNSANSLTKSIEFYINANGFQAERINTMGVYREGKKIQVGENTRQLKGKYGLLAQVQKAQLIYLLPLEVDQLRLR
jgi:hypothetical protein